MGHLSKCFLSNRLYTSCMNSLAQDVLGSTFRNICLKYISASEPCPALAMKSRVSSLLTYFHTCQRCGSVEQSNKVRILSHFPPVMNPLSFFTQFHTSQRCGSVEQSDKVRILSHFSPSHEPLVINYLVPHFSEVWKCRIV